MQLPELTERLTVCVVPEMNCFVAKSPLTKLPSLKVQTLYAE
jgi:hypothetical protein